MTSLLKQLEAYTTIVADTGDIREIAKYRPTDATTNPSLILAASKEEEFSPLLTDAAQYGKKGGNGLIKAFVNFGIEIAKEIPGRISTEVDARLSFDIEGSIAQGREYIRLYEEAHIPRERILIKLASTWEGIEAAKVLEKEGIACNMTLLFSLEQAIACAAVNATLISPFVGRILDWYKAHPTTDGNPDLTREDPGVLSVKEIYAYYKTYQHKTQVMGASFRNLEEILALSGCDLLTIAPKFLQELEKTSPDTPLARSLSPEVSLYKGEQMTLDEKTFRFRLNDNPMATEKLAEGIRKFSQDIVTLEKKLEEWK